LALFLSKSQRCTTRIWMKAPRSTEGIAVSYLVLINLISVAVC